jgi:hypothetical protein
MAAMVWAQMKLYDRAQLIAGPTSELPTIHQESSRLLCLINGEDLGCHAYAYLGKE